MYTGTVTGDRSRLKKSQAKLCKHCYKDYNIPMMGVEVEEFSPDMEEMIKTWESIEHDEEEWKVEEGVRRNGRRVSRRIS